ncbi:hypothetical protein GEMRC1_001115 [Eukaryota sp. GEM-RC1]
MTSTFSSSATLVIVSIVSAGSSSSTNNAKESSLHDNVFSDQIIVFKGTRLNLHRMVLAASSCYFHDLWAQKNQNSISDAITLDHLPVSAENLNIIFDYFYGSSFKLTDANFYEIFYLSRYFRIQSLQTACANLIERKMKDDARFFFSSIRRSMNIGDSDFLSTIDYVEVLMEEQLDPIATSPTVIQSFLFKINRQALVKWFLQSIAVSIPEQEWSNDDVITMT